ncbi:MAG: ABC transporter permease [Tannerella sp.]|jgi:putative ABC transport system permease protein|nr:ABC transporter permease [Tannerella sp.]
MKKYFQYFRQAWNIVRQERLFSFIYIAGTGLSITVVMALSIVFYIKLADIYPETNRGRLLTTHIVGEFREGNRSNRSTSFLSKAAVESCFLPLKRAEAVGVETVDFAVGDRHFIQLETTREQMPVAVKFVDEKFWDIFDFRFVDGKPFTEADVQSGITSAVVAATLAQRLFGTDRAEGRTFSLDFKTFRVCGVVRDVSFITDQTFAQVWAPYTFNPPYKFEKTLGNMRVFVLAPSAGDVEAVRSETADNVRRFNGTQDGVELDLMGQPLSTLQKLMSASSTEDFNRKLIMYGFIFFILLLIPAVSLSGMTHSRMERRMSEIGIRRAFGARRGGLMGQIITENLLFTLLGGVVGLLSSYVLIVLGRNWIPQIIGQTSFVRPPEGSDVAISPSMLLNFEVLGIALVICFVLNLMSSLIPAWQNSRRGIIHSLNRK